jgi:hypothetical protein
MADTPAVAEPLSFHEEAAFSLSQAALMLDQSRSDPGRLAAALENNMQVWIAIETLLNQKGVRIPKETQQNLLKLSQFTTKTTMAQGVEVPTSILDTFININLQISEGLLESQKP